VKTTHFKFLFFSSSVFAIFAIASFGQGDPSTDLPLVPEGLKVELYAMEPLLRNPGAMAFDSKGRLFVGYGPQYRNPKPDTPGDSVAIMIDSDGDGMADSSKVFATGFNSVQGLAWHGNDLWVGNSPDLTIVRDLDGDDVADEYVRVFTDLGNLEHANHGHNWAPDGKLYMSHGTSKGLTLPGRVAPKAFRDLWGVTAPEGTPDFPAPQVYHRDDYKLVYQDPEDDWGRQGGVLRCDDMGENLEIVTYGLRNPWDIGFDSGFNWLGNDNDQSEGDRIHMPFFNAHFGWGHTWSSHWTGEDHLPTVPLSGPVFDGSGTGMVYYDYPQMPEAFRGVWFINDWLRKTTFVYRPRWEGALLKPEGGKWQPFIVGGGGARSADEYGGDPEYGIPKVGSLYRPTDMVIGPDGSIYIAGWGTELKAQFNGGEQTNEGRIFRISWKDAPSVGWNTAKRQKPITHWDFDELAQDLGSAIPVWNINAQDELVRRGSLVKADLIERLSKRGLTEAAETWTIWTLGRISPFDLSIEEWLGKEGQKLSLNAKIQAIRIAGHRVREHRKNGSLPSYVVDALSDQEPRVRFAAVQSIGQARQGDLIAELASRASKEKDRITFYATWQALNSVATESELRKLLNDRRGGTRLGAMLALFHRGSLNEKAVRAMMEDSDQTNSDLAAMWIAKQSGNELIDLYPAPGVFVESVNVNMTPGIKPAKIRFTLDGTEPTPDSEDGDPGRIYKTTIVKAALFVGDKKIGNTIVAEYRKSESVLSLPVLAAIDDRTRVNDALRLLPNADISEGPGLFSAAGCISCHKAGDLGRSIGPDLSSIGDRDDADSVIRSILDPNKIIVEGYSLLTVATEDGAAYAGILESETDRFLKMVQLDSRPVTIDKTTIASRSSTHSSPMPNYERVLSPQQVADLTAWLMTQRSF